MPIQFATSHEAIVQCFPVMAQLRGHLSAEEFLLRVSQQQASGYSLVYLEDGSVKAVAGFRILEALSHGRFLYVDDLVTDESARSQGYGAMLLDWIADYARSQGCASVQLDSGTQRTGAHRFYIRKGLDIRAFRFIQSLS